MDVHHKDGGTEDVVDFHTQLEARLTEEHNLLEAILTSTPDPILVLNESVELIRSNPAGITIFNIARVENQPLRALLQACHVDEKVIDELESFLQAGVPTPIEIYIGEHCFSWRNATLQLPGKAKGWVCVLHEITARKQMEEALRESEQYYRVLFEGIDDAVFVHDEHGNILDVNEATCRRLGYTRKELLNMKTMDIDEPNYAMDFYKRWEHQTTFGNLSEIGGVHLTRDGRKIYVDANTKMITYKGKQAVIAVMRDISERKHAEEALRESENQYRQLFVAVKRQAQELALLDRVQTAIAHELDLQTVFRKVVEAIAETFGYTLVSIYTLHNDRLFLQYQVGYDHVISEIPIDTGVAGRVVRTGEPILIENVRDDPDFLGAIAGIVSEVCVPLFDQDKVVGIFNVESIHEVVLTEADLNLMTALSAHVSTAIQRAKLHTEVRESEAKNRALLSAIPDMIIRYDRDGNYLDIKKAVNFEPLAPIEAVLGQNVSTILPEQIAKPYIDLIKKSLQTGKIQIYEYQLSEAKGLRDYESRLVPAGNNEVLVLVRDITERKEAEKQALDLALEKERVRLLGQFISDVSHDFRTPLSTISTGLYLLGKSPDPHTQQERIRLIEHQVTHLSEMIDSLLTLVRLDSHPQFIYKSVDLNQLLNDVVASMNKAIQRKNLTIIFDLMPDLPPIHVDESDWGKMLIELVENAVRYSTEGGTITLQTYHTPDHIVTAVKDTGIGIEPGEGAFIFDRFYRTDKARRIETGGSGLGLTIARKIANAHGGKIEVESVLGEGSIFRVWMPK